MENKKGDGVWLGPGHLLLIVIATWLLVYTIFGWKGLAFFFIGQVVLAFLLVYYDKHSKR